jgi:plasmid stability protein
LEASHQALGELGVVSAVEVGAGQLEHCPTTSTCWRARMCYHAIAMAQLIVRNLPLEVVTCLKRRAADHNRSAEAEHRQILLHALLGEEKGSLKTLLTEMPNAGDDRDFARAPAKRRRVAI